MGQERAIKHRSLIEETMAGVPEAKIVLQEVIVGLLEEFGVEVEGMDSGKAAYEIYKYAWGLDVLEELYDDPEVNEIRVNGPDQVVVLRNIKNERVDVKFKDNEHIKKLVTRMTMHDQGVGFNRSNPTLESMRKDGTRITATCPPVTEDITFVLRKHSSSVLTPEDHIRRGSMDEKVWSALETLVRGRANILIAGGVGSGKTTLMRTLYSCTDPNARTIVIESDRELQLKKQFPERDIVELEEHSEVGRPLKMLFRTVLRYSPNIILIGEFRGQGEATEAVRACLRGHDGSMATAHFPSPQEAVEGTGRLLIEEGLNVTPDVAAQLVASAYNVVVQMFGDSTRGAILVESITEVVPQVTKVEYRDLIRWFPSGDDYLKGEWRQVQMPSTRLQDRLLKYGVTMPVRLKGA
ncbi:MAG: CpaF family protein [Syntrophothermus sp.]|uniref:ATPase, T2SS/T4P/T4SS family n=1 Tax=Syntrophothermus sp. TaxID=2736299 RepID=UPI00257B9B13|nr:ATPase, T2SS/T4P/T4SS family [Syntrophothermus sp.]NSW83999.1 CpaF family protein [Syntrophothermus sp.]